MNVFENLCMIANQVVSKQAILSFLRHKIEDHLTIHRLSLSPWCVYKSTTFFSVQVCVIIVLAKLQIV